MSLDEPTYANAEPTKRLFLSLLTRDIGLEDAILDLIDNCINSAIRVRNLDLVESFDEFISGGLGAGNAPSQIDIRFSSDIFEIVDNCGGIPLIAAKETVFRFGREDTPVEGDVLSVYGVGLKRALFKIGDHIQVSSQDSKNAFVVEDHARDWASRKETDWRFPLREVSRDETNPDGTKIVLRDILPDIKDALSDSSFEEKLAARIGGTYWFFIGTICHVTVNGKPVAPLPLALGSWEDKTPQIDRLNGHGCEIRIFAGLAPRTLWEYERAGWYIFCNGRNVIMAEKGPTTGWGAGMPLYMSKFRGFRGLVFFFAKNPENLPWTTTKTDINQESPAFKLALTSMAINARPVLNFLNSLYQDDEVEQGKARAATDSLIEKPVVDLLHVKEATFTTKKVRGPKKVRVQYDVTIEELNKVRRNRGKSAEPAKKIGRMTFDYYLKHEGL
jgi:hypothetical protein